jgi:hypothetical protein
LHAVTANTPARIKTGFMAKDLAFEISRFFKVLTLFYCYCLNYGFSFGAFYENDAARRVAVCNGSRISQISAGFILHSTIISLRRKPLAINNVIYNQIVHHHHRNGPK